MLIEIIDIAALFCAKRMVDVDIAEEKEQGHLSFVKLLSNRLHCVSCLFESLTVVIVLRNDHKRRKKLFNMENCDVFERMMDAINHKRYSSQALLNQLETRLQNVVCDVFENLRSDSCS